MSVHDVYEFQPAAARGLRIPVVRRKVSARWVTVALVGFLALAFQGSRGLWEPDEGFYSNAALEMLERGEWAVPRLNGEPFLDKPPLVYWTQMIGLRLLGRNEWGLRFGHALLFLGAAMLAGATARRLQPRGDGLDATLIYATLPLPFIAANVVTPDTPLAFGLALALYGLVRLETLTPTASTRAAWLLTGLGFGIALLAKGPAALPFAVVPLIHRALTRRLAKTLGDPWAWVGGLMALVPAAAWYGLVSASLPGAASYFLDQQVVGRLFTGRLERNAGWAGAIRVYLPTLVVGLAPWGWVAASKLREGIRTAWRGRALASDGEGPLRLLVLWTLLPLAVFAAARSRLPFYLLPIAFPVAVLAHLGLRAPSSGEARNRWVTHRAATALALALLSLKAAAAHVDSYRDTRGLAVELASVVPATVHRLIAVDVNRNGLALYRPEGIEWVTTASTPYPFYSRLESFEEEVEELANCPLAHALIVPRQDLDEVASRLASAGQRCGVERSPMHNPVLLCVPASFQVAASMDH
jgi:4-amino-4-deoxy-L-arabinose transferase-like glycosyltransferase